MFVTVISLSYAAIENSRTSALPNDPLNIMTHGAPLGRSILRVD
jgi:hypothetical protein